MTDDVFLVYYVPVGASASYRVAFEAPTIDEALEKFRSWGGDTDRVIRIETAGPLQEVGDDD